MNIDTATLDMASRNNNILAAQRNGHKTSEDSTATGSSATSTPSSSWHGSPKRQSSNNRSGFKLPSDSRAGHSKGAPRRPTRSVDPSNPRGYTHPKMLQQQQARAASQPNPAALPVQSTAYKTWREVSIKVNNLSPGWMDTWRLYDHFVQYAQISKIVLDNNSANITFSTTPVQPFWSAGPKYLKMKDAKHVSFGRSQEPRSDLARSPNDPRIQFPRIMSVPANYMIFGVMKTEMELLGMEVLHATPAHPIKFDLDLTDRRQRIDIRFSACVKDKQHRYRLQAGLQQIKHIKRYTSGDRICLVISLHDPPKYFIQTKNVELTHVSRGSSWKEWPRMWERQTDIGGDNDFAPVSLVKDDPVIDTGRWLTYRLDFTTDSAKAPGIAQRLNQICVALDHYNLRVNQIRAMPLLDRDDGEAWKYLNPHPDLHQMQHNLVHLDFDVRYQLEACISRRCLNEFNMNVEFFQRLTSLDHVMAIKLLENVAASKQMYHDPMVIFDLTDLRPTSLRPDILSHNQVRMHSITLTPTTLHINTPTMEVSNRVIRDYSRYADRFLRVKFEDEDNIGRIFPSTFFDTQEEIYNRLRRCMKNGIDIAGRHYDFLAYGNSQMRDHGCYFFASTPSLTADQICALLGEFNHIDVIAKYAARIGQCLSTTRTVQQLPRKLKLLEIPDVWAEQGGKRFCFTDGVGKVSPFVAQMIADGLRINHTSGDIPSVYQFRMGGYKGVLAVDPSLKGLTVAWRPSQNKFASKTEGLEIIRTSSYSTAYLNQQLILVLSPLGVPDSVFVGKMKNELARIDMAMHDVQTALDLLSKNVDYNQITVSMAEMIMDGFMATGEPFLKSLLELWRSWRIKLLKEKSHISIEKGAFVLGCTDETQTLRMSGEDGLPEIFIQVKEDGKYKARTGLCLLARNPSLHPGDIRVVKAIACPGLSHLKDAVVFPQVGERDLANMCSGGDLDGDDYLVMWDEELFPPRSNWTVKPMDFSPPEAKTTAGPVTKGQIIDNMINFIRYDRLGTIATRHRLWADLNAGGIFSQQCLELAALHSVAVDFAKSGIPAEVPEELMTITKWPHWMDNHHRDPKKVYHSKKVLGQLFDLVVPQKFQAQYDNPFDERILTACSPESMLPTARHLKAGWDSEMRAIMAQHGIETEFEVWTAFVLNHNREKRDYVFAEEMGRVMSELKAQHRQLVLDEAGIGKDHSLNEEDLAKLGPLLVAIYTVSRDQMEAAKLQGSVKDESEGFKPLISFPWIFTTELRRIVTAGTHDNTAKTSGSAAKASKQKVGFHSKMAAMSLVPLPETEIPVANLSFVPEPEPLPEIEIPVATFSSQGLQPLMELEIPVKTLAMAAEEVEPPRMTGDHAGIPAAVQANETVPLIDFTSDVEMEKERANREKCLEQVGAEEGPGLKLEEQKKDEEKCKVEEDSTDEERSADDGRSEAGEQGEVEQKGEAEKQSESCLNDGKMVGSWADMMDAAEPVLRMEDVQRVAVDGSRFDNENETGTSADVHQIVSEDHETFLQRRLDLIGF